MNPLSWFASHIILALSLAAHSPAAEAVAPPPNPEAGKLDEMVARSKKEALRQYPDLAQPDSIFARTAALIEEQARRQNPKYFETSNNYPLEVAESTADQLRAFSPDDPIFKEVIPTFTTKSGLTYSQLRVTQSKRNGIYVVHEKGKTFIYSDDLTDAQREKYRNRATTEDLRPEQMLYKLNSAKQELLRELERTAMIRESRAQELKAKAQSDIDRATCESWELGEIDGLRNYVETFKLNALELAYAAQESGAQEALVQIEHSLKNPIPEPHHSRIKKLEERRKAWLASYDKILVLMRGKRCELRRNGTPVLQGIPSRGLLGSSKIEFASPCHIRISSWKERVRSYWVFKIDLKTGAATLLPEASHDEESGEVTFHILE